MKRIFIILWLPLAALRGWVIQNLWAWFIVPFGVSEIGLWHATGISLIVTMLTVHSVKSDGTKEEELESLLASIIYPLIFLVMGYIYHSFM